jgi:mannosyl-oligosaccharide alpha-1,2-mannosidase
VRERLSQHLNFEGRDVLIRTIATMPGRVRRVRFIAIVVCIVTTFLLYERNAARVDQYASVLTHTVGGYGGSVLRPQKIGDPPQSGHVEDQVKKQKQKQEKQQQEVDAAAERPQQEKIANPKPKPLGIPQPVITTSSSTTSSTTSTTGVAVPAKTPAVAGDAQEEGGLDQHELETMLKYSAGELPANGRDALGVAYKGKPDDGRTYSVEDPTSAADDKPKSGKEKSSELTKPESHNDTVPGVTWRRQAENFPISTTIALPTGSPKPIPKIQHGGKGSVDTARLNAIKEATQHAWSGYRKHAWGADEVTPLSGTPKTSFNGWGATLIDSMDTLWIMGMKKEFEEAVDHVASINFQTSQRNDIPLFEVTIRYLGGLLGAYDVSGRKHKVLLEKATELAEVLYGAFDTPNRMPLTYYFWKPAFASQPHRAPSDMIMAEIGTLTLEMTRLAQLAKDPKFYDAVARITDALDAWQDKTRIPGLWPTHLDASGCEKPAQMPEPGTYKNLSLKPGSQDEVYLTSEPVKHEKRDAEAKSPADGAGTLGSFVAAVGDKAENLGGEEKKASASGKDDSRKDAEAKSSPGGSGTLGSLAAAVGKKAENLGADEKKAVDSGPDDFRKDAAFKSDKKLPDLPPQFKSSQNVPDVPTGVPGKYGKPLAASASVRSSLDDKKLALLVDENIISGKEVCRPKGLGSVSKHGSEYFTLGGASDSTFEYLSKEYLLLGGRSTQYKNMYLKSAEAAIQKLLFRPMNPQNLDILISGEVRVDWNATTSSYVEEHIPKGEHLTCFAGGMFAMGGRIFDRPDHIEIGRKLTDGCVWAYNSTTSGIMPETFEAAPCKDSAHCKWDEEAYHALLAPQFGMSIFETAAAATLPKPNVDSMLDSLDQKADATEPNFNSNLDQKKGPPGSQNNLAGAKGPSNPGLEGAALPLDASGNVKPALSHAQKGGVKPAGSPADAPILPAGQGLDSPGLHKRQIVDDVDLTEKRPVQRIEEPAATKEAAPFIAGPPGGAAPVATSTSTSSAAAATKAPLSRKEYIDLIIKTTRLPTGMTRMTSRAYILRPEAIESVFYMYRITGEQRWRDVGWTMFQAIDKATRTDIAHASIHDVTVQPGSKDKKGEKVPFGFETEEKGDVMESFCEYSLFPILVLATIFCSGRFTNCAA